MQRCPPGTSLRIREALLGRMRPSRCIADTLPLGCYDDVTSDVQRKCSGSHDYCEFHVGTMGHLIQSCPRDHMSYLNVWHECVAGAKS